MTTHKTVHRPGRLAIAAGLALGLLCIAPSSRAQPPPPWTVPTRISSSADAASMPDLVADLTGRVHVIWVAKADPNGACTYDTIMYATLTEGVWSEPQDILVTPRLRCVTEPAIAFGASDGRLHVIWSDLYQLWYSSAPAATASSARAWTPPLLLDPTTARRPDIVVDSEGRLHISFYQTSPDHELFYMQSANGGSRWERPISIHIAPPRHRFEEAPELAVDGRDRLHLVWTNELGGAGMSRGGIVYYTRSLDHGATWATPMVVCQKDDRFRVDYGAGEISVATNGDDEIHLTWAGPPRGDRWHEWSTDGGASWQGAALIAPVDALGGNGLRYWNGGDDLAVDSAGRIHFICSGGSSYLVWADDGWSEITSLTRSSPYWPRLTISLGNKVVVVYAVSETGGQVPATEMRIWALSAETDAPGIAPEASPTPEAARATPTPLPHPTPTEALPAPDLTPAASPVPVVDGPSTGHQSSLSPVLAGVLPTLLLVILVVLARSRKRS